jgi:pimeloyl-ACP methyl ester carboxylesterase
VEAVYKYVKQQGHTHVVIYGHSLGTAASVHITSLPWTKVSGLILESAFKSILQVKLPVALVHILPPDLDMFHNDKNLVKCVPTPVLFIHGANDNVIPMSHSVDMAASYPSTYVNSCWIAGGGHNNLANHPDFGRAIGAFLERFEAPVSAPAPALPTKLRVRNQWRTIAL